MSEKKGLDTKIRKRINKVVEKVISTTDLDQEKKDVGNKIELTPPKNSLSEILSRRNDLDLSDFKPKIAVIGVGGSGGNAIKAVINSGINDVLTITYNTDAQALECANSQIIMQLGPKITRGHGAGSNPEVGKLAAQESVDEIKKHLKGVHVAFIVCGMGGGTGTGAGPEIAKIALELGILTIGLVTTPFEFEGEQRRKTAKNGLKSFQENSDVLIVISNQNLFSLSNEETTFLNAFALTDEVLCSGLKSFIQTIKEPSVINVDVADFFAIMKGKKSRARMGTGYAEGENRGIKAAQDAMASPLLELGGLSSKDIDGVIICIRCGRDMTLSNINQAVEYIRQSVASDANIIFGANVDEKMEGKACISVFATSSKMEKAIEDFSLKDDAFASKIFDRKEVELETHSFDELLGLKEEELVGSLHSRAINESSDEYKVEAPKKGLFTRIYEFIFGSDTPKDDIPPYMK